MQFVRRDNYPLASFDSICIRCFRTVASRTQESELAEEEQKHVCDEADLKRISFIAR